MVDNRICVRHLCSNFSDEGHRGKALAEKLWAATSAYIKAEFNVEMEELKRLSELAYNYLSKIDPSLWI